MAARRLASVPDPDDARANRGAPGYRGPGRPTGPDTPLPSRGEQSSSWRGAESSDRYDPQEFYVRSTDSKQAGDSTFSKIRFPTAVVTEISRLVASGALTGTPIDGWPAFVRDAVVHRMHTVAVMVNDPMLMAAAEDQRRLATIEGLVREQAAKKKLVDDSEAAFASGMDAKDHHYVRELVGRYEPILETLRDPYSGQLDALLAKARKWLTK